MYYPQEVLDEVLGKTDIVEVVSAHVHLKKAGSRYVGLCPFHNEKTPSFSVNPDRQFFYCFGCGAGGSALTFLMKYNNSTFQEALQELADRAQVILPAPNMGEETKKREKHRQELFSANREAAAYYYRLLRSAKGERGLRYFRERGLSPETMHQFGLGFADGARSDLTAHLRAKGFSDELIRESDIAVFREAQGLHDRFWNRVMFPIQDVRGRVIGFGGRVLGDGKPKYLNSSDSPIFEKGRNLYALNLAKRSRKPYLILCEGYMDVIAMHQAGFIEAVASLGTAFTPGQAALLKRYTKKVLLAYDSDGAGVRAALRNIGILRSGGLESAVIDLRPHKDPDEFIKALGKEAFQERIDGAENSFFYELRMLSQSYRMDDPSERTAFHREIAKKLCTFSDEIERDNYIAAAAEKYFIRLESLRQLVAQYGRADGFGTEAGAGGEQRLRTRDRSAWGRPWRSGSEVSGNGGAAGRRAAAGRGLQRDTGSRGGPGTVAQRGVSPGTGMRTDTGARGMPGTADGRQAAAADGRGSGGGFRPEAGAFSGRNPQEGRPETGAFSRRNPQEGRPEAGAFSGRHRREGRADQALRDKQSILLTWIADEPEIFPYVSAFLSPEDFSGEGFVRAARFLWERLSGEDAPAADHSAGDKGLSGSRRPEGASAGGSRPLSNVEGIGIGIASLISSFDTEEEQEQAAAMFSRRMDGVEDAAAREKTLRELLYSIREASVGRMTTAAGTGGSEGSLSLKDLLAAKQQLQAIRSASFPLRDARG